MGPRRNYEYKSANDGGGGGMVRVEDRAATGEGGRGADATVERGGGMVIPERRRGTGGGRGIENDAGNPAFAVF